MKSRVHTTRRERSLTGDGLDKHHHEATSLKVMARTAKTKTASAAKSAKRGR